MSQAIGQIKQSLDIVDLIGSYITITKKGSNFTACCPFHMEKTPSFIISPDRQNFYCFGCHKHGDIFTFIQDYENLSFGEALRELAKQAGVELESYQSKNKPHDNSEEIFNALECAQKYFLEAFNSQKGTIAKNYIISRGFSQDTIDKFGVGYAPEEWQGLIDYSKKHNIKEKALVDAGLIKLKEGGNGFDFFRNRVMFPVKNAQGKISGFGGRVLDDSEPKYLNSPETEVFVKSKLLFNFDIAKEQYREHKCFIVMEGYTDVMMAEQYELGPTVATLGTSLTEDHVMFLKRYNVPIYLVYDGDKAGQNATERVLPYFLKYGVENKTITLPPKMDPCDFLLNSENWRKEWQELIKSSSDIFTFKLNRKILEMDDDNLEAKVRVANEMANDLKVCKDQIRKEIYLDFLSKKLDIKRKALDQPKGNTPNSKPKPRAKQFSLVKDQSYYLLAVMLFDSNFISILQEGISLNIPNSDSGSLLKKWIEQHHDTTPIAHSEFEQKLSTEERFIFSQAGIETLIPPKDKLKAFFMEQMKTLQTSNSTKKSILEQIKLAENAGDTTKVEELLTKL